MFDKLKNAINHVVSSTSQKTINEKDLTDILWKFELDLIENEVAQEVVDSIIDNIKNDLLGSKISRSVKASTLIQNSIDNKIQTIFSNVPDLDLIKSIRDNKKTGNPYSIIFVGINGTGKTTSVAKIAKMLIDSNLSVVIAAADTHRAGAIEQIATHANKLSIKLISQNYGADPAAVARDAILYATSHKIDVVLIDTAGRIQINKNLMDEISKVIRVIKPNLKLFVGDALAGNDTMSQANEFMKTTDFDAFILNKVDADVKGGVSLSLIHLTKKPLLFIGVGQNYEDFLHFDYKLFTSRLFNE